MAGIVGPSYSIKTGDNKTKTQLAIRRLTKTYQLTQKHQSHHSAKEQKKRRKKTIIKF